VGITRAGADISVCILSSDGDISETETFSELAVVLAAMSGLARSSCLGADQVGTAHWTPVKDFNVNPALAQRLQGFPVRSSARSLSLIAPVFALGPSLAPPCTTPLRRTPGGRLGSLRYQR
jgi:hypothetical protein